jgi:hypothetical protein
LKGKSSFENLTNLSHLPYAAFPRPIDIEKYLLDEGFFLPKINQPIRASLSLAWYFRPVVGSIEGKFLHPRINQYKSPAVLASTEQP